MSGGRSPPPPTLFLTKLRPKGLKKIIFGDPPSLCQSLDDQASPLSEGLDPPLMWSLF